MLWCEVFDWQISHAYFCFVSAFCFTCKHAETKLKRNNFIETKHCFAFVLFQFCFSFISVITTVLEWLKYKTAEPLLYVVYRTRNQKQLGRKLSGKDKFWVGCEQQSALELRWRWAADCTGGGFQLPETHDRQPWTAVYVGSPAVRMTTTGDGGGWNRRRAGCGRRDTVAPLRLAVQLLVNSLVNFKYIINEVSKRKVKKLLICLLISSTLLSNQIIK